VPESVVRVVEIDAINGTGTRATLDRDAGRPSRRGYYESFFATPFAIPQRVRDGHAECAQHIRVQVSYETTDDGICTFQVVKVKHRRQISDTLTTVKARALVFCRGRWQEPTAFVPFLKWS